MPNLADPVATPFVKALLIGDSGTGKTGALASLVKAGYELGILDMDAKLASGILPKMLTPEERQRVTFESFRDKRKINTATGGPMLDGQPRAYAHAWQKMEKWGDDTSPKSWGPDKVFVLDSLTFLAEAAYNWAVGMNPGYKDPRLWYGEAQDACENFLAMLTSDSFATHVVVISHVTWTDPGTGLFKGYPSAVGKALGPRIPTFFNHMLLAETTAVQGSTNGKRTIRTAPSITVDAKTSAVNLGVALDQSEALAKFFEAARDGAKPSIKSTQTKD